MNSRPDGRTAQFVVRRKGIGAEDRNGVLRLWSAGIRSCRLSQKLRSAIVGHRDAGNEQMYWIFPISFVSRNVGFFCYRIDFIPIQEFIIMKKTIFTGAATALITPLTATGVDYEAFGRLIDWQIDEGIDALVVCGTTGESSTLTDEEHRKCIAYCVERANKRVPVIAGTGSNELAYALELTEFASKVGADAALVVTPYYNKATQKGLVYMYQTIAEASEIPLILYNVPSRTGVNIEPETYEALADHENIAAFKEANGNISKIVATMQRVRNKLDMYSGNDDQIVPLMSLGGSGVISVLSNLLPRQTSEMCKKFMAGDVKGAAEMQFKYHDLIDLLFCEVNPIPVKAAMASMGFCEDFLRLPLTKMEDSNKGKMLVEMQRHGLI